MDLKILRKEIYLSDGRKIEIETGKLAKHADGSVVVRMGDTMLLATVVSSKEAKEDIDFLPLTVEYKEKYASNGRFPGGFFKREGKTSDEEILVSRLVDRVLRPMFPDDFHFETQLIIQLISYDSNYSPDCLAGLAASACLAVSDIPFEVISEVRVIRKEGQFIINPSPIQIENSDMDIIVGASYDSIVMVEGEMKEISEKDMLEAIKIAHEVIKDQINVINLLAKEKGVNKRVNTNKKEDVKFIEDIVKKEGRPLIDGVVSGNYSKLERQDKFNQIFSDILDNIPKEDIENNLSLVKKYFDIEKKDSVRQRIINQGIRLDNRKTNQIRPIWSEIGYLPSAHGSSIFTRGETQSLTTVTLGAKQDINIVDGVSTKYEEKFYLHYNFPPFSTGEVKPLRGVSRREIGHGNLAFRALKGVIPSDTPYTIRIVSDILESNGSSSMATVCAGTLALMDAGIKIKKPVSGIAMGLIYEGDKWAVLSDILGDEDHLGDMDFKVTGTKDGITACQMDMKIKGLSYDILEKALTQANEGRMHILDKMLDTISESREELRPNVPKIVEFKIANKFIGAIIGPSGKIIQKLQDITQTTISIEEKGEYALVQVFGKNNDLLQKAVEKIKHIAFEPEIGHIYKAKVKSFLDFGAIIDIENSFETLLHISEISHKRLESPKEELKEGDEIEVKILGTDPRNGKLKVSRKALLEKK